MTLRELYAAIDGDFDRALRVLRVEKLLDKHIRRLARRGAVDKLVACSDTMDPRELFDNAHAVKGLCANLGLVKMSNLASDIAEEYREGSERTMTDDEVKEKLAQIAELYDRTAKAINAYENE